MSTPMIIALTIAVFGGVLAFIAGRRLVSASVQYKQSFQDSARINLADLFLFIDPSKLFALNVFLIVFVFLLVFLLDGGAMLAVLSAAAVGVSPPIIYKLAHRWRRNRIVAQLPDALMSVSSNMRSGLSLNQALETTVTYENPPLQQELALLLKELKLGVDLNEALDHLYTRVPVVEIKLVSAAMRLSREIGGNLAETLERISDTLRKRLQMEGKIRSLTAQGKLQGLVMVGLPIFLIVTLRKMEPVAMYFLFHSWYGWATIAVIVLLELIGYHFIRKIVNIDV